MRSVILFPSSNYAIWAADVLNAVDLQAKLVSVPRQISSDCGYCVQIESQKQDSAEKILNENSIQFDTIVNLKD